jgi:thymidylate synthase
MHVITARNVHEALPMALELLSEMGVLRESRNGVVSQMPEPVTTVYQKPCERVLFWHERDANPFFHLYEGLWMLEGRNDVDGPARYARQMMQYSDNGSTIRGAYGHRWRYWFEYDQLEFIIQRLKANKNDRRSVLQMWDATRDADTTATPYRDVPCNLIATFQISPIGALDLCVFCRSNDIIWGCYGANAVHFSMLLEYMALSIGVPVGTYTQVSVNWHGYISTMESVLKLRPSDDNPYADGKVYPAQMFHCDREEADRRIQEILWAADSGFTYPLSYNDDEPFFSVAYSMLRAHHVYKMTPTPDRFEKAGKVLAAANQHNDWIAAGQQWLMRRAAKYAESVHV